MIYRVIGINSSIPSVGIEISLVEFTEVGGGWTYEIVVSDLLNYPDEWKAQLQNVSKKKRCFTNVCLSTPYNEAWLSPGNSE